MERRVLHQRHTRCKRFHSRCWSKLAVASADIKPNVIYTKWFHTIFFNLLCANYSSQAVNYHPPARPPVKPLRSVRHHFGSNEEANEIF